MVAAGAATVPSAQADGALRITDYMLEGECGGGSVYVLFCDGLALSFDPGAHASQDVTFSVRVTNRAGRVQKAESYAHAYPGTTSTAFVYGLPHNKTYVVRIEAREGDRLIAASPSRTINYRQARGPLIQSLATREDLKGRPVVVAGSQPKVRSVGTWEKGLKYEWLVHSSASKSGWSENEGDYSYRKNGAGRKSPTQYTVPKSAAGSYVWFSTMGKSKRTNGWSYRFGPIRVVDSSTPLKPVTKRTQAVSFGTKKGTAKAKRVVRVAGVKTAGSGTKVSYQWWDQRGRIKGATGPRLTLKPRHAGQRVAVVVEIEAQGHSSLSRAHLFRVAR